MAGSPTDPSTMDSCAAATCRIVLQTLMLSRAGMVVSWLCKRVLSLPSSVSRSSVWWCCLHSLGDFKTDSSRSGANGKRGSDSSYQAHGNREEASVRQALHACVRPNRLVWRWSASEGKEATQLSDAVKIRCELARTCSSLIGSPCTRMRAAAASLLMWQLASMSTGSKARLRAGSRVSPHGR